MQSFMFIAAAFIALITACGAQIEKNQLEIDSEDVLSVEILEDGTSVSITLTDDASNELRSITSDCIGETLALVVGGEIVSEPVVQETISGPSLTIACPDRVTAEGIFEELTR